MTYDEIMSLVKAGFNKDEILALAGHTPAPEPAPAPDPEPQPAPAPTPEPAPAPAPAPAPVQQPDMLDRILDKFDAMQRSMEQMAIRNSQMPAPETTDDILAAIIRPPKKEGK